MHAPSDPPPPAWVYGGSATGPMVLPPWLPPPPPPQQPLQPLLPHPPPQAPPPPLQLPAPPDGGGMASVMRALRSRNIALHLELERLTEALAAPPAAPPGAQQSAAQQRAALLERQVEVERTRRGALELRAETAEADWCEAQRSATKRSVRRAACVGRASMC